MKSRVEDLAYFGGVPEFARPLHVGTPGFGDTERLIERLRDIIDRRWLTNDGPYVKEFERRVAELVGVRHCVAMCNATVALEIAIRAAGLTGEVIVPSFTFIATAHALQWQQITPVFCDVAPGTATLDPARVEELITPRTTGIIGVHVWGRPCPTGALEEIARRRGLTLLFDAAHAFGCSHGGRMIGGFGRAEVFSFHATKMLNTFEGGAVVTNDDALAEKMRLMKNFGFSGPDCVSMIGTNGKMSEISAAMGVTGLESLAELVAVNRRNHAAYRRQLAGIPGLSLIQYDEAERCNYHYIVVEVDDSAAGIGRDQLIDVLRAENVLARRYFYPGCHRMEPYRSHFPMAGMVLPETERLAGRVLCLPNGPAVGPAQIETVCDILRFTVTHAADVRAGVTAAPAVVGAAV